MIVIKHQYLALGMTSYNHATLVSVNVKWDVKTKRSRLSKHSFHIYSVSSLKFINLKKTIKKNKQASITLWEIRQDITGPGSHTYVYLDCTLFMIWMMQYASSDC